MTALTTCLRFAPASEFRVMSSEFRVINFDSIGSTQDTAHEMIREGRVAGDTIIIAREQTAGRGRGGNSWVSRAGNLYSTFIFTSSVPSPKDAYLFAIAACETLMECGAPAEIKWPNDILIRGAKAVGILIEYVDGFLVAGIGINISHNPDNAQYPTDKIQNWNSDATADSVLATLAGKILFWRRQRFDTVRRRWMELAIRDRGYVTIKDDGALVVQDGEIYRQVYSVRQS